MKSNINPGDDHSYADRGHEDETIKDLERSRRTFSMREIKHNSSSPGSRQQAAAALESAVRRAFSMRASSVSGGYHRIDLDDQLQIIIMIMLASSMLHIINLEKYYSRAKRQYVHKTHKACQETKKAATSWKLVSGSFVFN